jgi:hypothetical protein
VYSDRIISRNLNRVLSHPSNRGLKLERVSVLEFARAVSHFDSLVEHDPETGRLIPRRKVTPDGRQVYNSSTGQPILSWKDTLTTDESYWIKCQRILCAIDFWYWVERCAWIKSTDNETVRMKLWTSQEIFLNIVAEMEDQEIAIFLIILKARQLGISRIITLILLHRVVFDSNINAYLASSTDKKTLKLFKLISFVLVRMPYWMQPGSSQPGKLGKVDQAGKLLEFFNGSAITMEHGQQTTGMARGDSPNVAHLSELAEFTDMNSIVDSALLRGMHPSPRSFLALEGTAEGINNAWHEHWEAAKEEWPQGRGRLRPLFLPWFVGGLYPKPVDLIGRPVPLDYSESMAPWAKNHAEAARAYVLQTDYLVRHLGSNWHMPLEQIWYYECERGDAIRKNSLNKFLQEMPANDAEAFQSSNITVFDVDTIDFYRTNTRTQPLWGVFGLRGPVEFVPSRMQPQDILINSDLPPISITADAGGGIKIPFELVPLKFRGWDYESDSKKGSIDKLYVWEPPIEGFEYGFGCDTGDGIDKDSTCIEGLRKHSLEGPTKQVCEFASGHVSALDVWPFLLALGTWYSVKDRHGSMKQPRMAIECRGKGDVVQNILRLMNWTNFHSWNDKQVDNRRIELSKFNKIGVFTNFWFRAAMIEMIVKSLRDGEIEICSPFFVKEMQSLEGDEMEQQLRAGYGGKDDRIMALGFILKSFYSWDVNYWRASKVTAYSGKNPAHLAYDSALLALTGGQDTINGNNLSGGLSQSRSPKSCASWAWGAQSDTGGITKDTK